MKHKFSKSKILLQNGLYHGEILDEETSFYHHDVRFVIGFLESTVQLDLILNHMNVKQRDDIKTIMSQEPEKPKWEFIGRKRVFKVELKIVDTATGPIGVNFITGVLPESNDLESFLSCWNPEHAS